MTKCTTEQPAILPTLYSLQRSMKISSLRSASNPESSSEDQETPPYRSRALPLTSQKNPGLQRVGLIDAGTHKATGLRSLADHRISERSEWRYDDERKEQILHTKHAHASSNEDDSATPFKSPERARSMLSSTSVVHPVVALEAMAKEKKLRPSSLQVDTPADESGSL